MMDFDHQAHKLRASGMTWGAVAMHIGRSINTARRLAARYDRHLKSGRCHKGVRALQPLISRKIIGGELVTVID